MLSDDDVRKAGRRDSVRLVRKGRGSGRWRQPVDRGPGYVAPHGAL